ncbi:MAG TPA: hypothetical protein VGE21_05855 [Flavobacteriales bacterium]
MRTHSPEFKAFANLVTAAAVNKRLLMRILAHLENKEMEDIHEEVAALDTEFRTNVMHELLGTTPAPANSEPEAPVQEGDLPQGREEERRGHALPNAESGPGTTTEGAPIGRDIEERSDERSAQSSTS